MKLINSNFAPKFINDFGNQRISVIREYLDFIHTQELNQSAQLEVIAARNTLACNEFKDREKAFQSLTPSLQEIRQKQARKVISVAYAKKFAELFSMGKVPEWVLEDCDFDAIELLTGR